MINAFLTAIGLGIAGVDPLGALLLMSAITAGMSSLKIKLFTITVFVSTILTGVLLSFLGTGIIERLKGSLPGESSGVWLYVNIAIAVVIIVWLVRKARHKPTPDTKKDRKSLQGNSLTVFTVALLFGVGAIFDPTFLANISFAAQTENAATVIIMHTLWITISQIMLFALFIAYLFGKHEKLVLKSRSLWKRHRKLFSNIIFGAGVLAVILLLADSLNFLLSGNYFFDI
jgi:hypothetical protein